MFSALALAFLWLSGSAQGRQPSAPSPVPAPLRNLTWGQLNFLHTTDTHGWLAGHLQEPQYSADWGDYVSFASHMRKKAEADGTDLLVIDTGDRIEGNGLYDASDPKGLYTSDILKEQHIDLLCSGNHELYKQNSSEGEYNVTVPNFKGNYLASNIDILDPTTGKLVPLAPRFKKFTTKVQGIRILAFGFLFDFKGNYNNTVVRTVEDTIKEQWFQDAIREEVDLFLVIGHVPVQSKEYTAIFKAIRGQNWHTPIQFFGGHLHIRDYAKYDDKAYGLASGRFMETIGFMSISGLSTKHSSTSRPSVSASPFFNRKYIDNNLWSFWHHTNLNEATFPTTQGEQVSDMLVKARHSLNLDRTYGCSPENFWMSRAKYPAPDSIYTLLEERVLPETLRGERPALVIANTGAIRFDMFRGPLTEDGAYILSPFTGGFRYTKGVPYEKATKILEVLNKQPRILSQASAPDASSSAFLTPPEQIGRSDSDDFDASGFYDLMSDSVQSPLGSTGPDLIPGYTTKDDGGDDGDDTIHSPISFYSVPNCIQAYVPPAVTNSTKDDPALTVLPETVDLIYLEFIEPWINVAAKFVGLDFDPKKDTDVYMPDESLRTVLVSWVERNWKCE